jgi:hypothetical protein
VFRFPQTFAFRARDSYDDAQEALRYLRWEFVWRELSLSPE